MSILKKKVLLTTPLSAACVMIWISIGLLLPITNYEVNIPIVQHTNDLLINNTENSKMLLFMHIPKTGGTSIERSAKKNNILWGRPLFRYVESLRNESKKLCNMMKMQCPQCPWHIPLKWWIQYKQISNNTDDDVSLCYDIENSVDYFCVVRHPFTKMLSEYKYFIPQLPYLGTKVLEKKGINTTKFNKNDYCNETIVNIWIQETIIRYRKLLNNDKKNNNRYNYCFSGCHFVEQYDFVYDSFGNQICQHIIHFENYQQEITLLFKQYNLAKISSTLLNVHATLGAYCSDSNLSMNSLTNKTKNMIFEFYKQDFITFGYKFS